jgi:uncharacterized membrane protein
MPLVDLQENLPVNDIINQSGILQKIQSNQRQSLSESIFTSLLLTIPLVLCHWLFDYLVHLQFGFEREMSIKRVFEYQGTAICAIFGFGLVTEHFKKSKFFQFLYFIASILLARIVILLVKDDGTFGR